jgi:hypothetical protein
MGLCKPIQVLAYPLIWTQRLSHLWAGRGCGCAHKWKEQHSRISRPPATLSFHIWQLVRSRALEEDFSVYYAGIPSRMQGKHLVYVATYLGACIHVLCYEAMGKEIIRSGDARHNISASTAITALLSGYASCSNTCNRELISISIYS